MYIFHNQALCVAGYLWWSEAQPGVCVCVCETQITDGQRSVVAGANICE